MATDTAKNIGVVLNSQLHMDSQINSICRSSYMYLHFISKIKPFLTPETVSTLVHVLVTSRLDNCNNLLSGCYNYLLKRLQIVHNCTARLILGGKKYEHVTPMLVELHWLPVEERIVYKIYIQEYTYKIYIQEGALTTFAEQELNREISSNVEENRREIICI